MAVEAGEAARVEVAAGSAVARSVGRGRKYAVPPGSQQLPIRFGRLHAFGKAAGHASDGESCRTLTLTVTLRTRTSSGSISRIVLLIFFLISR